MQRATLVGLLVGLFVVGLAGGATAATMTTSTSGTSYGSAHVGTASTTTQTITVENDASATDDLVFTVASDSGDYVPSISGGTLLPGESAQITVTFTPSARSAIDATLTVSGNDTANPSDTFDVSGTGTSGNLVVTWTDAPAALDFATALVDGGTTTRTITISNPPPANEALAFSVEITAGDSDFAETAPATSMLAVGESIEVTVTFDPFAFGTRTGTATVSADDAFNPDDAVPLTGVGEGSLFTPSLASLDFGTVDVGMFDERTLTITNDGNLAASITSISSGAGAYTFAVVGDPLPRLVGAGESVEVTVRFTPVDGSVVMADLSIATDGTPASITIPMTGDGLYEDVAVAVTGEPDLMVDLGDSRVGVLVTKVVTVTNTGETSVILDAPASSSTACALLAVSPATLPAALEPEEVATFHVRITPAAVGSGACTITVTTNIPTTDTIEISYLGVAPDVTLALPATGAINFGVIDVDAEPAIRTVVLDNDGTAPLAIGPCTVAGSARFTMVTSCSNLSVAPGASATLSVRFDPAVEASEAATLTIAVDALNTSQVMVTLAGVGADQRLDISALSVAFPDTPIGSPSPPIEYVDIFNPVNPDTGVAETLHISMATTDSEAFVLANQGPFTVEPGAMIRLAITFKPTAARTYNATLIVASDASATPMAEIALSGRAFVSEQQGGCCDSGRSSNGPLALGILLLLVRRRRR